MQPFHLAFPVTNLEVARTFYGGVLGCPEGRSSADWVDFDFYGHQIVAHLCVSMDASSACSEVDGHGVPVRHFGMVLTMPDWEALASKLKALGTKFIIEPYTRFKGEPGEQATLFFLDPFGNAIEFKAFQNPQSLFAK
jgi:extradiol dioxygenase family protein